MKTLSLKGGASKGLKYFRLLKEIYNKNIHFENLSGASSGGIFVSALACIRDPQKIYELFKALKGDRVMKWACEMETGKRRGKKINIFRRVIRGIGLLLFKHIPANSIKQTFKKHFSWDKATANGIERLCIGVVKASDVRKVIGRQLFNEFKKDGFKDFIDGDGFKDIQTSSYEIIKLIPMYFFCNDGLYKKEYQKKIVKISTRIEPLWKIVMATFVNTILPEIKLRFGKRIGEKCFDGGIANTYANTIWEDNNFIQCSCLNIPPSLTGKETGFEGVNTLYYNENRAKEEFEIASNVQYKGFFGFYDGNIEEYYKEEATNLF